MRILRVIASLDARGGGPVESVTQSSRYHASEGVQTTVLTTDSPEAEHLQRESLAHLEVVALGPGQYGYAYSKAMLPWLRENLSRFDAVLIHGLWLYPSRVTAQGCREKGRPYFVFPHGMLDPWFQSLSRRPLKTLRNALYWRLCERKVIHSAEAVLYTSEEERRLARGTFPGYDARETVVPYGTATPPANHSGLHEAFRERCPALGERPYLLFLSRLHRKKGVDLLVRAYQGLDDPPWDLVLAGPEQDATLMRELRETAGPRVHFPGMLEGDAKWGAFHGCAAFVLPSHQENFGIVVAEALGCGRPVLISDKVNIWREIDAAGVGLVEPDTAAGTAALLHRWAALSDSERAAMASAARPCFARHFEISQAASVLREVLLGNPVPISPA